MQWMFLLFLQWLQRYSEHLLLNQCCRCSSCLLCCVIHYCSTGWCCGTLLYCEEEMWLPEVLLSDNSSQTAAATASTSVWWHCWTVSEHWTEGECCIWSCAAVKFRLQLILIRWFYVHRIITYTVLQHYDHSAHSSHSHHWNQPWVTAVECYWTICCASVVGHWSTPWVTRRTTVN